MVRFSPDGQWIAGVRDDQMVRVWNASSGQLAADLPNQSLCAAFSPDGRYLVTADLKPEFWLIDKSEETLKLSRRPVGPNQTGNMGKITFVTFTPDGRLLLAAHQLGVIAMWETATGKFIGTLGGSERAPPNTINPMARVGGHGGVITCLAISPDGQRIASGCVDRLVRIWDMKTKKQLLQFEGHNGPINSVAFSPDGQRIASGCTQSFRSDYLRSLSGQTTLWNSKTRDVISSYPRHDNPTEASLGESSLCFSSDGHLMIGMDGSTIKIWDGHSGKEIGELKGHVAQVLGLDISADAQRVVSCSEDRSLRIWSLAQSESVVWPGHSEVVTGVAFNDDGQQLASAATDEILIRQTTTGDVVRRIPKTPNSLRSGRELWNVVEQAAPERRSISLVSVWDSQPQITLHHEHRIPRVMALNPDRRILATSTGDSMVVVLWDAAEGTELCRFRHGSKTLSGRPSEETDHEVPKVTCLAFSPTEPIVASGGNDREITLSRVIGDQLQHRHLIGHRGAVTSIAFSPGGQQLASVSEDGTVRLWNVESGELVMSSISQPLPLLQLAFSPDGRRIVTGTGSRLARGVDPEIAEIKLWDVETLSEVLTFTSPHLGNVQGLAFSPDGFILAAGGGIPTKFFAMQRPEHVQLWDATPDSRLRQPRSTEADSPRANAVTLQGHSTPVMALAYSVDGKHLVTGDRGGSIKMWDVRQGIEVGEFLGHSEAVHAIAMAADGTRLVTAGKHVLSDEVDPGSTIKLWNVSTRKAERTWKAPSGWPAESIALNATGTQVAASFFNSSMLRLWDATQPDSVEPREMTRRMFRGFAFGAEANTWWVASGGSGIELISADTEKTQRVLRDLADGEGYTCLALSGDSQRIVAGTNKGRVQVWDVNQGHKLMDVSMDPPVQPVFQVSISHTATHFVAVQGQRTGLDFSNGIKVWNVRTGESLETVRSVNCAAVSPEGGRVAYGLLDGTIIIRDADPPNRVN